MARKPTQTAPAAVIVSEADTPSLPAAVAAQNLLDQRTTAIADQFGDGLPYDRTRIVSETRFYMAQSAEAMLEAGKRLILLKENEAHGEFVTIVESALGIHERAAQRMMKAALKYLSPALQSKATTLSVLGKAKLFELVAEDDEDLAELADGGTVAGLKLDDVDRMSVRELRASLRESRENADAQGRLLSEKNEKIDELAAKLNKKKPRIVTPDPDQEGEELRKEASAFAFEAEAVVRGKIRAAFQALAEHSDKHGAAHSAFMAGLLCQVELAVNELRSEFDIPEAPSGDPMPDWLKSGATRED
ncbi:hypothetical protein [Cupriavidus metallidurans]|uniref:DUF3102 domain-containing protein n=1 Tax=Cupriavidus metallidurans TaxID=119219 RepID=A0A482IM47_9BURK|nr:hypothetical protein [Cupriavidus metallidurans]QBP09828.1 DUF3102 domain-containing protein [Cupriavidus metallidurans]